ncbi:hypothetical protein [Agrococcus sp. HG114]|uniref:hypothetical protein n=1 Tax=Agrococcus sp. HG114 TaxID=2969757 RepID=UPI00215B66C5|nr:hypothetical protein [Agrococcus sp. HG114]MCR8670969.1 hypothetical protein [Agrococcus sp. HG114]
MPYGVGLEIATRVAGGERVAFRGRLAPLLLLLVGGAAFTVAGLALVIGPLSSLPFGSSRWDSPVTVLVGAACVLFFGVMGGDVTIRGLAGRSRAVELDPHGIRLYGAELVPWHAVRAASLVVPPRGRRAQVHLLLTPEGGRAWRTGIAPAARWLQRFSPTIALVPDVVGLEPRDLQTAVQLLLQAPR